MSVVYFNRFKSIPDNFIFHQDTAPPSPASIYNRYTPIRPSLPKCHENLDQQWIGRLSVTLVALLAPEFARPNHLVIFFSGALWRAMHVQTTITDAYRWIDATNNYSREKVICQCGQVTPHCMTMRIWNEFVTRYGSRRKVDKLNTYEFSKKFPPKKRRNLDRLQVIFVSFFHFEIIVF